MTCADDLFFVSEQNLLYLFKDVDVTRVWPSRQSLTYFVESGAAAKTIKLIVDEYFSRLVPVFDKIKSSIEELSVSARRTFVQLSQHMEKYQTSMAISSDFVRCVNIVANRSLRERTI